MLRTRLLARAIAAALLISAACGPSNVAKPPAPTAPGSPTGDPNRGTVGDGGGNVTSRGGGLVVAVPAGATAAPVEISITEITNTAPHGVGRAYRLGPEGTRFTAPVALIFRTDPDASLSDLTIATQDATGYWVRVSNVRRDPTAHTIVATTTHFSDWALVVAPSERDLSGIFRIASTRDGVVANGVTRFYFESSDEVSDYFYLQSGRITAETPISRPGATCQPLVATKDVGPNIGEIHLGDANPFIWGATGIWDLTCTPTAGGPQTQDFASVVFENLGLNYPRCTRSYLAPPLVQPEDVQGSYQINCGAEGTINADWHFQRCVPGEVCQTANTCKTAAINCDYGLPLCVENGNVTNGTVCDIDPTAPYEVCGDGVCNVCRIDQACTPTNPCHIGKYTCDTGFEVCTDTGALVANGTACDVDPAQPEVCGDGTCNVCNQDQACTPSVCNTGNIQCATGFPVCADTGDIANGSTCDVDPLVPEVCFNGTCNACTAGNACTTNPNECVRGTTSCATGQETCIDTTTNIANGTACVIDATPTVPAVCNGGVCNACTAGNLCATNPNRCVQGTTSCTTGQELCVDTATPIPNGTTCDVVPTVPEVCNNGVCNACTSGNACATNPNPCVAGTTSCATGVETCVDTTTNIPNGTSCGTNLVCFNGSCNPCTASLACATNPNECVAGTTSCATGQQACIDTTTNIANGTACVIDATPTVPAVCNGGGCNACTANLACTDNPNPCLTGLTSCSTGTSVCLDNAAAPEPNGAICGTNQVCLGGVCNACTAGQSCAYNSNPCVNGVTSCATGSETCENTATPKVGGTVCGTNLVCNGTGACIACTADLVCTTNPTFCLTGLTSCSTGAETCVDNAAVPEPNGLSCGTNQVCSGGACSSCTAGLACTGDPDPCHTGTTSCATGSQTCETTSTPEPNGTTCGTNAVCNGGVCNPCTADQACATNPNPCVAGTTSCATGVQTCVNTATQIPNGTSCDVVPAVPEVCSGGACAACTAGLTCDTNPDPCLTGITSCSTGTSVCVDNAAVPEPNGTSCAANQVCNGGACVGCTAGLDCTPATACTVHQTSCATGTQQCVDTGVPRPNGSVCGTDLVCNAGGCVTCIAGATCTTNPDLCLTGITSCSTGTSVCLDNAAVPEPNGTVCGAGLVCNGGVCSACTAGLACTTNPDPCLTGTTSCSTGTQTCVDNTAAPEPNGTVCGGDQVCNGGACVACVAGGACPTNPDPCLEGVFSCASGTQQCVNSATPKADGTICGTDLVCSGGACTACTAGVACGTDPDPCHTGATSCATGSLTCVATSTPEPNGTSCGTNQVCSGGACVTCTAGGACGTNPNPCVAGVFSCATGTQTCVDNPALPDPAGTSCGTDQVCNGSGVCNACTADLVCATNPNPCLTGITSCSTGTQACLDNPLVSEPNGTVCGTDQVCSGGVCTGCTAGLACGTNPTACLAGVTSCATGSSTCVDSGTSLSNGTGCGTNLVCNAGACVSCTAGQTCATNPAPCLTGTTSCSTGTSVCIDNAAAPEPNGTTCGSSQVCSGGTCTTCVAGQACTTNPDPCKTGTTSCSTGTSVCVDTTTNEPNGTGCGANQVCNGGACVACTAGGACATNPNPCVDGAFSCATGSQTCDNTATPKVAGTACGTNQVCNGSGACVACTAGADCTPANSCTVHQTSCATGSQTCVDTLAPVTNGTVCGTNQVCNGGVCSACTSGQTCTTNPNLCLAGTTSCSTGTQQCLDTAAQIANGTTCGTNQVCNAGACVACAAGGACSTNPNRCVDGVESCATGALTCTNTTTQKANGTSCGTDQVCNSGTCVGCVAGAACVTNPNICVAGVTSCATGAQICENGATPANEGATCGPDLVCSGGACIRVITGTRLVTRWSTTGTGCSAAAPCTTTTVAPDVVSLTAIVEAIGPDLTRYPGTFSPSGSFSIPNVPPGPYTLAFTDGAGVTHFIQTSSSTVDLGYDVLGREATAATAPTPVTISVSALSGWIESDEVQITAPDVDLWDAPISGTEIVAGEVNGSVVEDWSATSIGRALNLLAATDVVWMHQLATSTVTGPPPDLIAYAYQAATRSAATAVVPDMANGAAASLSATLAPITQTGNLLIDWRTTQFEALLSSMGPSAQPAANPHALVVRTLPYALSSPAPVATGTPELFRLLQPAGTADANLSTLDPPIVYGRFLDPALWSEWRDASFTARVSYTAPGAATPMDALARISRREPMLPAPPIQIVPELGTVQAPLVNGANALGTLGAVGPTPTIGWSAPLVGAPSSYRVTLRELFVGAGSASATRVVATFSTSSSSLTVPAGVLVGGRTYFAEIAAQVRSPERFDTAPNRANTAGSDATTLTATFTP